MERCKSWRARRRESRVPRWRRTPEQARRRLHPMWGPYHGIGRRKGTRREVWREHGRYVTVRARGSNRSAHRNTWNAKSGKAGRWNHWPPLLSKRSALGPTRQEAWMHLMIETRRRALEDLGWLGLTLRLAALSLRLRWSSVDIGPVKLVIKHARWTLRPHRSLRSTSLALALEL